MQVRGQEFHEEKTGHNRFQKCVRWVRLGGERTRNLSQRVPWPRRFRRTSCCYVVLKCTCPSHTYIITKEAQHKKRYICRLLTLVYKFPQVSQKRELLNEMDTSINGRNNELIIILCYLFGFFCILSQSLYSKTNCFQ